MVNEFNFGKSYNTWSWYPHDPAQLDRANVANPPHWFDEKDQNFTSDVNQPRPGLSPGSQNFAFWAPGMSFGGGSTVGQFSFNPNRPYTNYNDIYSFNDNLCVVRGGHSFKAGHRLRADGQSTAGRRQLPGVLHLRQFVVDADGHQ